MSTREKKSLEDESSTDFKAIQDISSELADGLPPWSKSNVAERLRLATYYAVVFFPVIFVVTVEVVIVCLFILFYIVPLVGNHEGSAALWFWHSSSEQERAKIRGWTLLALMLYIMLWLNISFYRAIATDPGKVPKSNEWKITHESESASSSRSELIEKRKDGNPRHCIRCMRRKPDRCHHCRLCERCVLKMDHHCPWIANCVGYENYKYFYLLVMYSALGLILFVATFWEAVVIYLNDSSFPVGLCLMIVSAYALACMLLVAILGFLIFHTYLIYNDLTTIEYCEKRRMSVYEKSPYRTSLIYTLRDIFGNSAWAWPFPFRKF
mmetsp:Transcript_11775/g.22766  ORF Transcript_11775/g.22766 Transcript_11775/m.22766 type:complete len:324 (+) Transcript_11775:146-1117(+)